MSETSAKKYLVTNPNLPYGAPMQVARKFEELMLDLEHLKCTIHDKDQWDLVFQKLLEAKDCAVRAVLDL